MKHIIKATLLSGLTTVLWFYVFLVVGTFLIPQILGLLSYSIEYIIPIGLSAEGKMFFVIAVFVLGFIPIFIFGMLFGFIVSLFYYLNPKKITRDNNLISSLKHRTRSFGAYCLFIGEGLFGIVALLGLSHCILTFIFPPEVKWMCTPLMLAWAVLVTALSVWIIWRCEVYIAEERQSAAQTLHSKHKWYQRVVTAFGVLPMLPLAINIYVALFVR